MIIDKYECQCCGCRGTVANPLEVHHLSYGHLYHEETRIYEDLVGEFINQCGAMAEENWLLSQVEMLERLFGAVLHGCKYDEWEPVEM